MREFEYLNFIRTVTILLMTGLVGVGICFVLLGRRVGGVVWCGVVCGDCLGSDMSGWLVGMVVVLCRRVGVGFLYT